MTDDESTVPPTRTPPRRVRVAMAATRAACVLGLLGLLVAVALGFAAATGMRVDRDVRAPYAAREQHRDDLAWLILRAAARRHLDAVRTGTPPDDEALDDAIAAYAGAGERFFRGPGRDPMPGLAAVRTAADDLRPLDAKRVGCSGPALRSQEDARCTRYYEALVGLFGRDL